MATFAVVTDGADRHTVELLRQAGADVRGLLGPDPYDSLAWAAAEGLPRCYADLTDLLHDDSEAVCIDDSGLGAGYVTRAVLRAGRHVLLSRPVPVDTELLELADSAALLSAVALPIRSWPGASAVEHALPSLGDVSQVTVHGWPAGHRLALVDLVRRWCGDVVAVCASSSQMPAALLAGTPVTLALLTASGTTAVVAELPSPADPMITIVGSTGRIVVTRGRLQRSGRAARMPADVELPQPRHPLGAAAAGLVRALWQERGGGSLPPAGAVSAAGSGDVTFAVESVATLRDLLAAQQVIAAADTSLALERWAEL